MHSLILKTCQNWIFSGGGAKPFHRSFASQPRPAILFEASKKPWAVWHPVPPLEILQRPSDHFNYYTRPRQELWQRVSKSSADLGWPDSTSNVQSRGRAGQSSLRSCQLLNWGLLKNLVIILLPVIFLCRPLAFKEAKPKKRRPP